MNENIEKFADYKEYMSAENELELKSKIDYRIKALEEELFQISRQLVINKEILIRIKQIEYALTVLKSLIPEEWVKDYEEIKEYYNILRNEEEKK